MFHKIEEEDWKKLRQMKDIVLHRLCERILQKAQRQINKKQNPYESYLALYKLIQKQDKVVSEAFDALRRSNAITKIANMAHEGLFTKEEFEQFSDKTKELVQMFAEVKYYREK